jgi:adenylate cyclase
MLTSKQLIDVTGISRATMNNYVAQGLLPRPDVKKPEGAGERARQLGYFPDDAVDRVAEIQDLKKQGLTMDQIVARLVGGTAVVTEKPAAVSAPAPAPAATAVPAPALTTIPTPDAGIRLTLDDLDQPAYMVNYNFHVEWSNQAATRDLFGVDDRLDPEIDARSLFKLVLNSPTAHAWVDRSALLAFQLSIAKVRLPKQSLGGLGAEVSAADFEILGSLYDDTTPARAGMLCEVHLNLAAADDEPRWHTVFASFFREGILFVHQAADTPAETFLELLSRRDHLIRSVVKSRQPILTPVCVLVADLQDSMKICAELPPEEYFELINQVWQTCETVLRKYHATQGKHAGDGMVSYFFPQPDCSYLLNALDAADELKSAMAALSKEWQLRKQWINELYLNIGLNEGEEWFGTYHTATNVEFTVLGDTINHAGRLSDYARFGSVWVTKNLIGKLTPEERQNISFGIRRTTAENRGLWIPATYSRISNLIDLNDGKYEKFRDIATLAITEVTEIDRDGD